jgi:hypothetical protein
VQIVDNYKKLLDKYQELERKLNSCNQAMKSLIETHIKIENTIVTKINEILPGLVKSLIKETI